MTKYIYNPFTNNLDAVSLPNPPGSGIAFLTGNSGGPVGPDGSNNVNIRGDSATGITVVGNPGANLLTISGPTLLGTANQIAVTTTPTTATIALTNGISLGSYQATTPPVGGMLVPGVVCIGATSSFLAGSQLFLDSINFYGFVNTGTHNTVDGSGDQLGVFGSSIFAPTLGSGNSAECFMHPTFQVPVGRTITLATAYMGQNLFIGNVGTVTNSAVFYALGASPSSAGTITNAYGGYFNVPATGTNRLALYSDNITVGTPAIPAPPSGAFITGQTTIGTLPPDARPKLYVNGGTIYGIWNDGTRTTRDPSTNQIGVFSASTFSPTIGSTVSAEFVAGPVFSVAGGQTIALATSFFGDNLFTGNAGTITRSAVFASTPGVVSTGTIVNAYGAYFNLPVYGANNIALYADNMTIGSPNVVPPTTGARILGSIRNDALTTFEVVGADGSSNLVSIDNGTSGQVLTSSGPGILPSFQGALVASVVGTANQISESTVSGVATIGLTDGISLGSFQPIAPPTGGMLIPGPVSIGDSSVGGALVRLDGADFPSTMSIFGEPTSVDGNNNQYGINVLDIFFPTSGANIVSGFGVNDTPVAPTGQTINLACGYYSDHAPNNNQGTITNLVGFYSDSGFTETGVVTNCYGGYFNVPNAGTNKVALFADNLAIGGPGTAPPALGALIFGPIQNTALTASEVVGTDASKNLVSIASGTAGFLLTSNGASAPTFQAPPVGFQQGVARYVVTPSLSLGGGYTSIQTAINQAVTDGADAANPATVWIWPGTYTEDLTLTSFVNLSSAMTGTSVTILGAASYTAGADSDTLILSNVNFQGPVAAGPLFSVLGAHVCSVSIDSCLFTATNGTSFLLNNSAATVITQSCFFTATSGFKCFDIINSAVFAILNGGVTSTDTASTIAGNGVFAGLSSPITDSLLLTGNAIVELIGCSINSVSSFEFLNIGATNFAIVELSTVQSSAASGFWATGSGEILANGVSVGFSSANEIDPALLSVPLTLQVGQLSSAPPDSNGVTAAFGNTFTPGTGQINAALYDVLVNVSLQVSSATAATIVLGVGPTSTPLTDTVVNTFTVATPTTYTFSAYVPTNYYMLVDTTGTITITSVTSQVMAI